MKTRDLLAISAVLLLYIATLAVVHRANPSLVSSDAASFHAAAERARWFYDSGFREPLFPALTRIASLAIGSGVGAVRAVSFVSSILTLLLIVLLGRRAGGAAVGGLAALLWIANPRLLVYAGSGDRVTLTAGFYLLFATLLFRRAPTRRGIAGVAAVGAALALLRSETLPVVIAGLIIRGWAARGDQAACRRLATATGIVLLAVLPYHGAQWLETGDPTRASALHARFWSNREELARPIPDDLRRAIEMNPYHGGPLSPVRYILMTESPPRTALRFLEGYVLLLTRYLPHYALPWWGFYPFLLGGAWRLWRRGRGDEVLFVLLTHLPFAYIYPIDQIGPGSGIEARFSLHGAAIFALWSAEAMVALFKRLKRDEAAGDA